MAGSDFSGSCIIGFDSSSSRCGPAVFLRWPNPRSPDSRTKSVHTCQGLRPRRVGRALALAHPSMLPSVILTTSAPETILLSRLHGWPMHSPADASPTPSRMPAHGSGPMRIATPSPWGTFTSYSLPVLIGAPEAQDRQLARLRRQPASARQPHRLVHGRGDRRLARGAAHDCRRAGPVLAPGDPDSADPACRVPPGAAPDRRLDQLRHPPARADLGRAGPQHPEPAGGDAGGAAATAERRRRGWRE